MFNTSTKKEKKLKKTQRARKKSNAKRGMNKETNSMELRDAFQQIK